MGLPLGKKERRVRCLYSATHRNTCLGSDGGYFGVGKKKAGPGFGREKLALDESDQRLETKG